MDGGREQCTRGQGRPRREGEGVGGKMKTTQR